MLFLKRFLRDESGEMDEKVVMMVGIILIAAQIWKKLGNKIVEMVNSVIAGMG